jgi:hypothetical protein
MNKYEVPSDQWPSFMDQFSRLHQGKNVDVTIADDKTQTKSYAHAAPLLGIVDERHGASDESIELILGNPSDGAQSHSIARPSRICVAEWNDAYSAELEIESPDGRRMLIQVGPSEQLLEPGVIMDGIQTE